MSCDEISGELLDLWLEAEAGTEPHVSEALTDAVLWAWQALRAKLGGAPRPAA